MNPLWIINILTVYENWTELVLCDVIHGKWQTFSDNQMKPVPLSFWTILMPPMLETDVVCKQRLVRVGLSYCSMATMVVALASVESFSSSP